MVEPLRRKRLFSVRYGFDRRRGHPIPLTIRARRSLIRCLETYGRVKVYDEVWGIDTYELPDIQNRLLYLHGRESLKVWDEGRQVSEVDIHTFLLKCSPPHFMDCLELAVDLQWNDESAAQLASELSAVFYDHDLPFRFDKGLIVYEGPPYFATMRKETETLLIQTGFEGALEEFRKAVEFIRAGRDDEAILNANNALESTIKGVLGARGNKGGQLSTLLGALKASGYLSSYDKHIVDAILRLLESIGITRNRKGSHGQRVKIHPDDPVLAEFVVNTVAAAVEFLIQRHKQLGMTESSQEHEDT